MSNAKRWTTSHPSSLLRDDLPRRKEVARRSAGQIPLHYGDWARSRGQARVDTENYGAGAFQERSGESFHERPWEINRELRDEERERAGSLATPSCERVAFHLCDTSCPLKYQATPVPRCHGNTLVYASASSRGSSPVSRPVDVRLRIKHLENCVPSNGMGVSGVKFSDSFLSTIETRKNSRLRNRAKYVDFSFSSMQANRRDSHATREFARRTVPLRIKDRYGSVLPWRRARSILSRCNRSRTCTYLAANASHVHPWAASRFVNLPCRCLSTYTQIERPVELQIDTSVPMWTGKRKMALANCQWNARHEILVNASRMIEPRVTTALGRSVYANRGWISILDSILEIMTVEFIWNLR